MRIMGITDSIDEYEQAPAGLKENEFLWMSCSRQNFEARLPEIQEILTRIDGQPLLDFHAKDLLSTQQLSHYDYTSAYDVIIFRHMNTACSPSADIVTNNAAPISTADISAPDISSHSVGFIVYNRILLSVFDEQDPCLEQLRQKLQEYKVSGAGNARHIAARIPSCPDELMLYLVDTLVGNYTNLRQDLSLKLEYWQAALMSSEKSIPSGHWEILFKTRNALYLLDDLYEDQNVTLRAWQESIEKDKQIPYIELLTVRARDVIEHIERTRSYVNRLQAALESAIQIHFSATANHTNQVMRVLTVITAIFLPLNLLTGLFGMNFNEMFLTKYSWGFWLILALMAANTVFLVRYFARKKYLK